MSNESKDQFDKVVSLVESFDARLTEFSYLLKEIGSDTSFMNDARLTQFAYLLEEIESNTSFMHDMVSDIKHEVIAIKNKVSEISDFISKLE